jgi:hypothetical protein
MTQIYHINRLMYSGIADSRLTSIKKEVIIKILVRIDSSLPYNNFDSIQTAARKISEPVEPQKTGIYGPGVVVEISAEGRAAAAKLNNLQAGESQGIGAIEGPHECQTCKNRKYVDESNDPSVSYQAPTHISPGQSASAVMAHEREHVTNEQARADREDRKVVSQTVSVSTSICPECGRVYVSGGVTRTVTKGDNSGNSENQTANVKNAGDNNA